MKQGFSVGDSVMLKGDNKTKYTVHLLGVDDSYVLLKEHIADGIFGIVRVRTKEVIKVEE